MTYDEYLEYGGKLDEENFNKYIDEASLKVDALCFFRLTNIDLDNLPNIKYHYNMAVRYIVDDFENINNDMNSGIIQSESEGDYSVTYKTLTSDNYLPPKLRLHIQWLQGQVSLI